MIIVLKPKVSKHEIQDLVEKVESYGLTAHVSQGTETTIIGMIGDVTKVDPNNWKFHLLSIM